MVLAHIWLNHNDEIKRLPINMSVLQLYAPTEDRTEEELEKFFKS